MYCDFCGNKLSYNVRYCRSCGRQMRDRSGDTQPIPVIDATILQSAQGQAFDSAPWYKVIFKKKTHANRSRTRRVMCYLASVAILAGLIYILAIFKTVKEYQILTSIIVGSLAIYVWWRR